MTKRVRLGLCAGLCPGGSVVVIELQQEVAGDLAFERGHMVFGVAHVLVHQTAHGLFVAGA